MATGGGRAAGKRDVCTVCLETYRQHEAKILPCYHTFCVPCLAGLAQREEEVQTSALPGQDSDGEGGRSAPTVTCPTCRRVIPVPAGGVTAFQRNFYLDTSDEEEDALCHLCDGERKAQFQCHKCRNSVCSQCQRSHDKVCQGGQGTAPPPDPRDSRRSSEKAADGQLRQQVKMVEDAVSTEDGRRSGEAADGQVRQQVKMVEDALKTLSREESRLQQDKEAVEDSIRLRYAAALRHVAQAHDACCLSFTEASHGHTQRLTSQMAEARHARDTLQPQLSTSQPAPVLSASQLRAALFLQGDLPIILSRKVDDDASWLTHQVEDDASVMTDALRSFMGRVVTSSQSSDPAHSQAASGSLGLQDDRGVLSSVGTDRNASADLYRNMEDLAGRVNCLQSSNSQQLSQLSDSNSQLSQQVTLLSSTNRKMCSEQSALQREVSSVKEQNVALQREVRALKDKSVIVHQDLAVLTAHKDNVGAQLTTLDSRVVTMQTQLSSQQTDLAQLKADHAAGLSQPTAVQSDVNAVPGDETSLKKKVGQLKTGCAELKSDQAKVQGDISDLDKLKLDLAKVQGDISDLDKLKLDLAKVQGDISDLDKLKSDLAKVQGDISDLVKLKSDLAKVQGDISDLVKLKYVLATSQSQVASLEQSVRSVQDSVQESGKAVSALEARFVTANTQVAFHARLSNGMFTTSGQVLICDSIIISVGGGYDGRNGAFTAPLAGTYCFMANTSPGSPDMNRVANLGIVLDSVAKGSVFSRGDSWSTVHTVVKMKAGQRVWLTTYGAGQYTFYSGDTFFTGMLIQADV